MAQILEYPKGLINKLDTKDDQLVSSVKFSIVDNSKSRGITHQIYLYMPETFENPTNLSWDSQGIGFMGQQVLNGAPSSMADVAAIAGSMGSRALLKGEEMMLGALTGKAVSGEDIVALSQKKVRNPYLKMLFRGVNFRTFEFVFKFAPRNEQESQIIADIIKSFRTASLPEYNDGDNFLGYPNEVKIEYLQIKPGQSGSVVNKWLNKFKNCVITDVHVNYTGAGFYATMRDGFPSETELRIQFSENEILTRKDIEGGY
jgi:hypothetical protein